MRNRAENQVILVLIRHGETKANKERRYLGRTDEPLSEEGRENLMLYRQQRCYPKVQYLFVSPMKRCIETAEILYSGLYPVIIPEWKEVDFGRFEYKNYEDLRETAEYQEWVDSGGTLPFPGGESREEFVLRCGSGFERMCSELRCMKEFGRMQEPVKAGLIVHGGTIMALLSRYGEGRYFDYQVPNGRGYVCKLSLCGRGVRITKAEKI